MSSESDRLADSVMVADGTDVHTLRSDLPVDVIPSAARINWEVLQNQNIPGSPAYLKISAVRVAQSGGRHEWAAGSDTALGDPENDPALGNPEVKARASARWNEIKRDRARDGGPFKILFVLHLAEMSADGEVGSEMFEVGILEARG